MLNQLMQDARGFQRARVLLSAAEHNLFTLLADAPRDAQTLAAELGGDARAMEILLDALVSMGYMTKVEGRYRTPDEWTPYLTSSGAETMLPSLVHSSRMWDRWSELSRKVVGEREPALSSTAAFVGAMDAINRHAAPKIIETIDVGDAKNLIDVGGALGTFTAAFLDRWPNLRATLFDLPEVVQLARPMWQKSPYADRVELAAGDFTRETLPPGHDLAWVSAILHMFGPEEAVAFFKNVAGSLLPGGRVIIRDHVMSEDHTQPTSGALFAVNMLVGTPLGGTYSLSEIEAILHEAHFERVSLLGGQDMNSLVEAYKPGSSH